MIEANTILAPMGSEREQGRPVLRPIGDDDIGLVADFLEATMDAGVTADGWAAAMRPPWSTEQPNHGFMLLDHDRVVGAYLAIYADREIGGRTERFCNLAAWSVVEEHRVHSLRLLRAILKQRDYHMTDFSPSGNVVPLNERLGFSFLDNTTALVPCLPTLGASDTISVIADDAELAEVLTGDERRIHLDHRGTVAQQVALKTGDRTCLIVFRRERWKRLPLFVTMLFASDPELFVLGARRLGAHLLRHHRAVGMMVEQRLLGGARPRSSFSIPPPRARMYRSKSIDPGKIDYLYSELASVAW